MAYKIVQTIENGKKWLFAIPSAWESDGHLFWPPQKRVAVILKLLNDVDSKPDIGWSRRPCKLKRQDILTFAEAEEEINRMETYSGTSSDEGVLKQRKKKLTQRVSTATLPPLSSTSYNEMAQELLSCGQPPPIQQQIYSTKEQDTQEQHVLSHIQPSFQQCSIDNVRLSTGENIRSDLENVNKTKQILRFSDLNLNGNTFQYIPSDKVYEVQEITLSDIMREMQKQTNLILENQQKIILQLSKQQTTIDYLLELLDCKKSVTITETEKETKLMVIESVEQLDDLEAKLLCTNNKSAFIKMCSSICGTSGKHKGGTCSYRLIDKIISRNLLTQFSWGGGTRQKETAAAKGLRNLTLTIEPSWVRRGQSAQLHCHYELEGAPLYSVKWYRGNLEFYRYSPFENPPAKIFPYTGIKVDLSVSNATQVTLRNVGFNLSGNFTCEVTADAPSFYTAEATNVLKVVELPSRPPTLWTERIKYDPGDILKANCSTTASKPPPSITFLINNLPVGDHPTILHSHDNLHWASRDLELQLLPSHYLNGMLILRCSAEVDTLYAEQTEAPLGTSRKEPIPERVTSPGAGAISNISINSSICLLLISFVIVNYNKIIFSR